MNVRELLEAFDGWRRAGADLVLASVFDTDGSTYSKAGAQMLIDSDGHFQGMLSGGCLEGDLAERAAQTLADDRPQAVTYDLGSSDEDLWGLGVGCDGTMRIFLQPLRAASEHAPFSAMAEVLRGDRSGAAATVIESARAELPAGAALVMRADGSSTGVAAIEPLAVDALAEAARTRAGRRIEAADGGAPLTLLIACLRPPPRVLVLGGGLDAGPVVRLLRELGWRVTVQDHRPAYIERGRFDGADEVCCLPADALGDSVDFDRYDAAIVMSHHLQTDRRYLEWLAGSGVGYVGLLGPIARRRRLLADLGAAGKALDGRVHGPAGLDLGGRGPASIALSIVAELHRYIEAPPENPADR